MAGSSLSFPYGRGVHFQLCYFNYGQGATRVVEKKMAIVAILAISREGPRARDRSRGSARFERRASLTMMSLSVECDTLVFAPPSRQWNSMNGQQFFLVARPAAGIEFPGTALT